MECNVILAGVGGQGILTIAQAISLAAIRRGWAVKQSEVHGMAQRGGAVQSHLRVSDQPLYSDLVPLGKADVILSAEPLEALRYVQYLCESGAIVTSTTPVVNIPDYPPIEEVLGQITRFPRHVLVDAERLARLAGSPRAVNTVMLGAALGLLGLNIVELEAAISEMFHRKGPSVIAVNQRACRIGRNAATAYVDGLERGAASPDVRHWIEMLPVEELEKETGVDATMMTLPPEECELTREESHAVAQILDQVYQADRRQLFEHEIYELVRVVGAISPPHHHFAAKGDTITVEILDRFPGDRVVLKIVSPEIVHKSEAGAVVFVPNNVDAVNREIEQLIERQSEISSDIRGVLIVEFVQRSESGFGQELFVGIRSTREFGAIIAAGLGGLETEYLAHKMRPGIAVAKALAVDTSAEQFLELFRATAAYEVLAGRVRGRRRVVSDGELLRCFRAFIAMARRFCTDRGEEGPDVRELEVNPFAFARQRMIPLDGRGQLGPATKMPRRRPLAKIQTLLEPRNIAVMGASAKRTNFGRILLQNVKDCGFPQDRLVVIKERIEELEGIRCVPSIEALPERIDLLVIATASKGIPQLIDQVIASRKVSSVILIPGGMGEKEGTEEIEARIRDAIIESRDRPDGGVIVLGGNCLGVRSRPGRYDTFFIPPSKLDARHHAPPRRAALISQSGAFIISRLSNLELLDPTLAVSLGNQVDLTVSDLLRTIGDRDDIDCIGVYIEGFNDLDGIAFVEAVGEITARGKVVVFYKAGRTPPGRAATAGHTASVAGDYDVCQAAVSNAGAIVVETFKEFEQLTELGTSLHEKKIGGLRIGVISNAGFETVGMADSIQGERYQLDIPDLSAATARRIQQTLDEHKLGGLVNVRNPLDLTPMANEDAYEGCIRAMLDDDGIDAVVVAAVPLTPQLLTTPRELKKPGSLVERLPKLLNESNKPLIAVVDSGAFYEPMVHALRQGGVPTFRSADEAVRSLGRYLCHRTGHGIRPRHTEEPSLTASEQIPTEVHV